MQAIREMYELIKRLISRRNLLYNNLVDKDSIAGKLLDGVINASFNSDTEAVQAIYAEVEDESRRVVSFRTAKYQLVNKLTNALVFLNVCHKTYSSYLVNAYSAKKELVAAELLMWFSCHSGMRLLVGRILKKAKRFHLSREQLRCYEMLRHYATIHGTEQECLEFAELVEESFAVVSAEVWAANAKVRIRAELTEKLSLSPDSLDSLLEIAQKLEQQTEAYQTRTLWQNCGVGAGLVYRHAGQYDRALHLYERHLQFFEKNPHLSSVVRESQICFYALRCCLVMRNYEEARKFAAKGLQHEESGTSNWFAQLSMHCLLAFHSKQWQEAATIFQWVVQHPHFSKEAHRIEIWSVFEGYLRYFCEDQSTLPSHVTVHGNQFQLHHLLEEIDVVRQDKSGLNISVLIFQVLHRLRERQFELLESRVNALKNYLYKYLRKDSTGRFERTETLFQMFVTMVNCQFESRVTREQTRESLQQLYNFCQPDQTGGQHIEEIVPYEHVWERVLLELEKVELEGVLTKPQSMKQVIRRSRRTVAT